MAGVRMLAALALWVKAAPPPDDHVDTIDFLDCRELPLGLPDICVQGSANVCTRDISLVVNITMEAGTVSLPLELGDGTEAKTTKPTCLTGLGLDALGCSHPCFHIKDVALAGGGFAGCIEFHLDCIWNPFGAIEQELTCIEFGEGPSTCDFAERCDCLAKEECGWCPSSSSCTRLLPASLNDPLARDIPACSCAAGVVLHNDPEAHACWPSPPPPSSSPSPPPPPSSSPSPPPPPSTETVVLTLTASGNIDDYDKGDLEGKIATRAGVDASLVSVTITAASVLITATIAVPASTTAAAVQTSLSSSLGTAAAASEALGITVEEPRLAVTITPPGVPDDAAGAGTATPQWVVWAICATLGSGWYLLSGLLGLSEARTLRRSDMGLRTQGGGVLHYLPERLQFSAGVACTRLDEAEIEISWAGQPVLLVAALAPVFLWLIAMVFLAALTGMLQEGARALELLLLLLPVAITLPLLVHLRRLQGTLYMLTARGAVELRLQCACLGRRDAPRRTRYGQMLALPVVRAACHQLQSSDLLFAQGPTGGEVGFRCLPTAVATTLQHLLRDRVAALPPGDREVTGGVVLRAIVQDTELSALEAVAVGVEVPNAQAVPSTPPLTTSTDHAPPMDKPTTV